MAVDLVELTNTDKRFYLTLGPFLANRDVVKQVGGPIWDDDTKTWLVAVDKRTKKVLGFVAVAARGARVIVESLYVRDGLDRVAAELVGGAVARFGGRDLTAMVAHPRVSAYTAAGFTVTQETVNFAHLARKATS